ncbi:unnamed protein product [Caenorhabditis auriculariae]|uniref:small monomeric GTPase n=1 Tax=Caenorhabditis auriculariae TaxID=2777116 RepID=A0A8S1HJR9_9PELO|nr:unnamed protein product [Caenorhabditis auriculariae]
MDPTWANVLQQVNEAPLCSFIFGAVIPGERLKVGRPTSQEAASLKKLTTALEVRVFLGYRTSVIVTSSPTPQRRLLKWFFRGHRPAPFTPPNILHYSSKALFRFDSMSPKSSSRLSHSDYGSTSFSSDDDEFTMMSSRLAPTTPPGVCPHCSKVFEQPVSLQCGHSLCLVCCHSLLVAASEAPVPSTPSRRPRMGVSSYVGFQRPESRASTPSLGNNNGAAYRTPQCIVCGAPPNMASPIPNLELESFLRNIRTLRLNEFPSSTSDFDRRPQRLSEALCMHECRIAVVGARGVGKTSLTRVQYSNEIMFPDLLGDASPTDSYIIDIIDGGDLDESMNNAHGFIVMYSVSDRRSFYEAAQLFKQLEVNSEHNQPIVLVGSKKDQEKKREVPTYEGQKLGRAIGCPFLEVSAKRNDCVSETFSELMILIQKQQKQWQETISRAIR